MKRTIDILYIGFRPYVKGPELNNYDKEFLSSGKNSLSYAKAFFPKFIDIVKYSAKPKKYEDAMLFNYYLTEMEVTGLKVTKLLKDYKKQVSAKSKK
ncbi:MAG TPA: hypothetical protein VK941_10925 [Gillisia sp.]|nr:hypothetical protein [Gillisia sp.]